MHTSIIIVQQVAAELVGHTHFLRGAKAGGSYITNLPFFFVLKKKTKTTIMIHLTQLVMNIKAF